VVASAGGGCHHFIIALHHTPSFSEIARTSCNEMTRAGARGDLVKAELMARQEADQVKRRLAEVARQTGNDTPEGNGETP
jgi:hypothetical protein